MTSQTHYSYKLISSLQKNTPKDIDSDRLKQLQVIVNTRLNVWLESKGITPDCDDLWVRILNKLNTASKTPIAVILTGSAKSYVQMATDEIPEDIDFLITGISDAFLFTQCFRAVLGGEINIRLSEFEFIAPQLGPIGEHFECNGLGISTVKSAEDLCSYYSVAHSTCIEVWPNIETKSLITNLSIKDAFLLQKLCEENKVLFHFSPEKPRIWSRLLLLRARGYKMVSTEFDKRVFLATKGVKAATVVRELKNLFKMHAKTKEEKRNCVFFLLQQYKKYDSKNTFKQMHKHCREAYPDLFPLEKLDIGVADAETGAIIRSILHRLNPVDAEISFQNMYDDLCTRANEIEIKKSKIMRFKEALLLIYPNMKDKDHTDVSVGIDFITRSLTTKKLTSHGATCFLYCVITSSDNKYTLRDPESEIFKAIDRLTKVDLAVLRLADSKAPINILKKELNAMMQPALFVIDPLIANLTEPEIVQLVKIRERVHLLPEEVLLFNDRLFAAVFQNENLRTAFKYDTLDSQLPAKVAAVLPAAIDEGYVTQIISFNNSELTTVIQDKLRKKFTKNVTLLFDLETQPNTLSSLLRSFDIKLPKSASYSEKIARLVIAINPKNVKTLPKELVSDFYVFPKSVRKALLVYFQTDISRLGDLVKCIKTVNAVNLFFECFMGANSVGRESKEVWSRLLNLANENPDRRPAIYEQAKNMETNPVFETLLQQCEKPKSMEHLKLFFEYVVVHFRSLNFTPRQKITFLNQYITVSSATSAEIKYSVMNRLSKRLWQDCEDADLKCSSRQRSAWGSLLRKKTVYFDADLLVLLSRLKVKFNSLEQTDSLKKIIFENPDICRCLTQSDPLFVLQCLDPETLEKFPLTSDVVNLLIEYIDGVMRTVFLSKDMFGIQSFQDLPIVAVDFLCMNYRKHWRQIIANSQKKVRRNDIKRVWQTGIYNEFYSSVLSTYMADKDWVDIVVTPPKQDGDKQVQLIDALLNHEFYFFCSSIYQSIEDDAVKKQVSIKITASIINDFKIIFKPASKTTDVIPKCHELFQKILSLLPVFDSEITPRSRIYICFSKCIELAVLFDTDLCVRMLSAFREINISFLPDPTSNNNPYKVAVKNNIIPVVQYYHKHYPELKPSEAHPQKDNGASQLSNITPALEQYEAVLKSLPNLAEAAKVMRLLDLDLLEVSLKTIERQVMKPGFYSNYVRIQQLFFEKYKTLDSVPAAENPVLNILNTHLLRLFEFAFNQSLKQPDFVLELLGVIDNSIQNRQHEGPVFIHAVDILHRLDKEFLFRSISEISQYSIKMLDNILQNLDVKNEDTLEKATVDLQAFKLFTAGFASPPQNDLAASIFGFDQSTQSYAFISEFKAKIKKYEKSFTGLPELTRVEKTYANKMLAVISKRVLAHLNLILSISDLDT